MREQERRVYRLGKRILTSKTAALRKKRLAKEENTDITKRPDNHWENELWIEFTGIFCSTEVYGTVLINKCSSMGEGTVHGHFSIAG